MGLIVPPVIHSVDNSKDYAVRHFVPYMVIEQVGVSKTEIAIRSLAFQNFKLGMGGTKFRQLYVLFILKAL